MKEISDYLLKYLQKIGIHAKVRVTGKDVIEIRRESQDLLAKSFPLPQVERPVVKTHLYKDDFKKFSTAKKKEPPKTGFNLSVKGASISLSQEDSVALEKITQSYKGFISVTKKNSGVWNDTIREIVRLSSGLFVDFHAWDSTWLSRAEAKNSGPSILNNKFKEPSEVLHEIKNCLDYVASKQLNGGYWWPPLKGNSVSKRSVGDFIVSTTRSGTEWSPFADIYAELHKELLYRDSFSNTVVSLVDCIIKESPFLSTISNKDKLWDGVARFTEWYIDNKDSLLSVMENKVRLADISRALTLVREWNADSKGRALPAYFVYPGAASWRPFKNWCKDKRGVIVK